MEMIDKRSDGIVYISLFVVTVHFCLVAWSWIEFERIPTIKKTTKLVVKTVPLAPKKAVITVPKTVSKPIIEEVKSVQPKKIETVQESVKKIVPKKKSKNFQKKTEKPKTQVAKEKVKPAKKDLNKKKLLSQAQESIAKIEAASAKIGTVELKLPELRQAPLASDELSEGTVGYRDELANRLQLMLKMPEVGQVKIKLTLGRSGNFMKLTIVSSESNANRKYIEKALPTLIFPSFGSQMGHVENYTFSITLNSDL